MNRVNLMFGFKDQKENSQIFSFKRDGEWRKTDDAKHEEVEFLRLTIEEYRARYDKLYNI
jgi:hypothetical protein